MSEPLTSNARLRAAVLRRIKRFGKGRMEVHSAVLEALTNDAMDGEYYRMAYGKQNDRICELLEENIRLYRELEHLREQPGVRFVARPRG